MYCQTLMPQSKAFLVGGHLDHRVENRKVPAAGTRLLENRGPQAALDQGDAENSASHAADGLLGNARELGPALSHETFRDSPSHAACGLRLAKKAPEIKIANTRLPRPRPGASDHAPSVAD